MTTPSASASAAATTVAAAAATVVVVAAVAVVVSLIPSFVMFLSPAVAIPTTPLTRAWNGVRSRRRR